MVATLNKPTVAEFEGARKPTVSEFESSPFMPGTVRYEIPEEPERLRVWEPKLKERVKNAISGMAQRSPFVQPGKRLGQLGLHHFMESISGLGIFIPDILASKITQEDTLASAVDKFTGFEPTPRDVGAGEAAKFVTSLHTVGRIIGPGIAKIPVREVLRFPLGGGIQFGARGIIEETSEYITTDKPIDWGKVHAEAGFGTIFGIAEATLGKIAGRLEYNRFIKTHPAYKIMPRRHFIKMREAMRAAQKGMGRNQWRRLYGKDVQGFLSAYKKIHYPIRPELKGERPPTIGKLAPRRPVAPITPEKRVIITPKAPAAKPEAVGVAPEAKMSPLGLPITSTDKVDITGTPVQARYNKETKSIEIGEGFDKLSPARQKAVIAHEEGHHVLRVAGFDVEAEVKKLWDALPEESDEKKLIKILHPDPTAMYKEWFAEGVKDVQTGKADAVNKDLRPIVESAIAEAQPPTVEAEPTKVVGKKVEPEKFKELRFRAARAKDINLERELIPFAEGWQVRESTPEKYAELEAKVIKAELKAEPVKPKGKPGKLDVTPLLKVHQTFMKVLEPARAVERIAGKEAYAAVIKGIHQTDVGRIEFTEAQLVGHDKSIGKLGEWFNKFSDKDLRNLMLSRGQPTTVNAELIQQNAINNLPKALKGMKVRNAIEQIANFNYAYLQKVAGDDINKVADYFYGIYKDPDKVDRFLDYWRTTKRFTKEKKLPTVADAVDYGLELRNYNPIENLKAEYLAIAHLEGMTWMRDELLRTGKGKYIDETLASPMDWRKVNDPVFRDLRLQPDLAHLINNLIATNKITRIPTLNTLRQINNVLRTVKFIGSAFHLLSVAKQSVADSGYLGFLYKPTALRGITRGFKANDPIFRTTEYKGYIGLGGGHRYSVESEARRAFTNAVNELNRNMGLAVKVGALPLRIPTGFVNWMFQSYIPKVKYSKFLDVVAGKEKKLGRKLTSPEKIDIIKEQQNFYGMMNERLFGRSGTVTTAMRFYFMSPGYAEGNYRTMLKAAMQWGGKGGFKANRSRSNIINSWLITGIAATVGTLAFTGKPPKKPEKLDDARDLFKIDTGKMDEKGRKIMIDLMTYDKDYWNVAFNILRLRPDVAVGKSWYRLGGMKAPTAEIIHDLTGMMMGKAIMDWKNDRIYHITDPFLQKVMKLTLYEVKRLKPISVSVYEQSRKRDIDKTVAAIETLLGLRPTKTEKELREQKLMNKMFSLRGQQEELSWYIGQSTDPKRTVARYNKTVNDILNSPYVPKSMKTEWGPKLLVDYENVVTWKRFPAGKMNDAELSRAYDAHTLSVPYKRRGEPFRQIGAPKKGSERRVSELKAEAQKRGIELRRGPRKKPRR